MLVMAKHLRRWSTTSFSNQKLDLIAEHLPAWTERSRETLVRLPQGRREPFPRLSAECQRSAVPVRGVADQDDTVAATGLYAVVAGPAGVA